MAIYEAIEADTRFKIALVFGSLAILGSLVSWLFSRPPLGKNAPQLAGHSYPLLGALQFFTQRWDFIQAASAHSSTGNFSFHAGKWPVVYVSGKSEANRKLFFENKGLGFGAGYRALLGGSPDIQKDNNVLSGSVTDADDFDQLFVRRIGAMLKGPQLKANLPKLLADVRRSMDALATGKEGITNPFDSVYRMVYQLTMRTVGCNDFADDDVLLDKSLHLFEVIEQTGTPLSIMWPWIPVPARAKRLYAGFQLYMMFKKVVDERAATGKQDDDALQFMMGQGDDLSTIIQNVVGALFAGQLNSGINAAWILIYMTSKPEWFVKVRDEVESVANKYAPDSTEPLKERLMKVPMEGWDHDFPVIDLCLRESIRLQLFGTAFRRNVTNQPIPLDPEGKEVIPPGQYASMSISDFHHNNDIYNNETEWDPSRYLPDRAEDKKEAYAYAGWGMGRHPCLGMRFAKLENNMLVSFFLAYFDEITLADRNGNDTATLPRVNRNSPTAAKPLDPIWLKYKVK
ncbi:Hypothetical protein R9X50_00114400 [Acrodontium crateriforme]|uniref:Cytochrome P450 n=1 Tax=Acrodontium crateriforme TaxID=150365 RepID=A0AAQ3R2L9_9PEZI|nr:Hypothetical protein R9X50_00114400 [Acrodontium crateriforme]